MASNESIVADMQAELTLDNELRAVNERAGTSYGLHRGRSRHTLVDLTTGRTLWVGGRTHAEAVVKALAWHYEGLAAAAVAKGMQGTK